MTDETSMTTDSSQGLDAAPTATARPKIAGKDYRVAIRPDDSGMTDDVVVCDVSMFRAEMMDNGTLWLCCYLKDSNERIAFWVSTSSRRSVLRFAVTEMPTDEQIVYESDDDAATCYEWRS